jgi:Cu+-exporting ATPase
MRNRRVAFIFLAAGVLVVAAYLLSEGREGRVERNAEKAAFAVAHPGSEATLVTLDVDGMSCPDCAKSVKDELSKVDGVVACRVDLGRHIAEVRLARPDVPQQALLAAVSEAGYDAHVER